MKRNSSGKAEFTFISQIFVGVTDATANVGYISNEIQKIWSHEYDLVTNDGLPIIDCPGTQGLKFWKTDSRKIYAVKSERTGVLTPDSEDEIEPLIKRKKVASKAKSLTSDIKSIRNDLKFLIDHVPPNVKIPLALYKRALESFSCQICKSIIVPPAIFSRCCKRILGCQICVDTWYQGSGAQMLMKKCPLCRFDRAYTETTTIRGLDDFLTVLNEIITFMPYNEDENFAGGSGSGDES
ncbi:PREDICTED: uncharacterized protein LOC109587339 [Amphimedon queenslandica]|nr:PREDICTED: uncharacterized protein LOC109587339 [Amphimedon queenslandica]|eukprot:XP_019859142.1 PREDICTED: uncharacterized protein LOC109587339 [Amphimedon queenslandica]